MSQQLHETLELFQIVFVRQIVSNDFEGKDVVFALEKRLDIEELVSG